MFALGPNHRALICDEGFDSLSGRLRDSVSSVGMVWVMSSIMSPLEIWLARYCSTTARHLALTSEFPTSSGWPAASFSLYWVVVVVVVVSLFRGGPIQERQYPYYGSSMALIKWWTGFAFSEVGGLIGRTGITII